MFKNHGKELITLIIVVDDLLFASNSRNLVEYFKKRLAEMFDVKLFCQIGSFLGWEIEKSPDGIRISQRR